MAIYFMASLALLNYTCYKGSKVLISLFAIDLGASNLLIGFIYSMYAVFPIFLAVYAGKAADRIGMRAPMLLGTCGLAGGLLVPWMLPNLAGLTASAVLIGLFYIFFAVSMQAAIGFMPGDRTRNYSILSLGNAASSFFGPVAAGFSIDANGHVLTYLFAGLVPLVPVLWLTLRPGFVPRNSRTEKQDTTACGTLGMLREHQRLRRILLAGAATEAALELYAFYMPIYGNSIGLSASKIGAVMGIYAIAMVAIRVLSPWLVGKLGEDRVLRLAMLVTAGVYCAFPFASELAHLALLSFVLGLSLGCCVPLTMMIIHGVAPAGRAGEAVGARQTINKVTDLAAPLVFGTFGTMIGMAPLFWACSAMLIAGSAMVRPAHLQSTWHMVSFKQLFIKRAESSRRAPSD